MNRADFEKKLRGYQEFTEDFLSRHCFVYPLEPQQTLFEAMRYSLLAGGKRLRPALVFGFCEACCGNWEHAASFAAAVEMVHTYSLIHDDLPSMDNDDYRRGRPTNHKVYGEANAILAGDALLTSAFGWLAKSAFPAEIKVRAVEILADCSGELGMVGGQILDMASEIRQCTEQEILNIQSRKTGALIRAACTLGVLAGGGSKEQMEAAGCFADHIGIAFQIRDDMLDRIGDSATMGKATGTDIHKNTFVHLYGMRECGALVQKHTTTAISALSGFENADWLKELANYLSSRMK